MGLLTVTVLGCQNIPATDAVGGCDPYIVLECSGKTFRTRTQNNNLNPVFNEQFRFFIADPQVEKLCVILKDSDTFKDEVIGKVNLSLHELRRGVGISAFYPIHGTSALVGIALLAEDFGLP